MSNVHQILSNVRQILSNIVKSPRGAARAPCQIRQTRQTAEPRMSRPCKSRYFSPKLLGTCVTTSQTRDLITSRVSVTRLRSEFDFSCEIYIPFPLGLPGPSSNSVKSPLIRRPSRQIPSKSAGRRPPVKVRQRPSMYVKLQPRLGPLPSPSPFCTYLRLSLCLHHPVTGTPTREGVLA